MLKSTGKGELKFVPRPKNQRHEQGPLFMKGPSSAEAARGLQAEAIALFLKAADDAVREIQNTTAGFPPMVLALLQQSCEQTREAFKLRTPMRLDRVVAAVEKMLDSRGERAVYRAPKQREAARDGRR